MGLFSKGDRIEVTNDRYPDPAKNLNGTTGTVTGTDPNQFVYVQLDGEDRRLGFGAEELEHR